jgi:uncharacterized protein YndB with AHSA1/START domain
MTPQAETRTLVIERDIRHPAEKVWRALTQPHLIAEWLMQTDFEPVVGRPFQLRMVPSPSPHWDGVIQCELREIEPHERLTYTWASMGLETLVTFTLTPTDAGVHLRMEQSGLTNDANFNGARWGWTGFLEKLDGVVERL